MKFVSALALFAFCGIATASPSGSATTQAAFNTPNGAYHFTSYCKTNPKACSLTSKGENMVNTSHTGSAAVRGGHDVTGLRQGKFRAS